MARNELDRLIDQLLDTNDPRKQKKLIKQIAKLEDPRSITPLASIYNKSEVDAGVKKAAADALRFFRGLDAQTRGTGPQLRPVSALDDLKEMRDPNIQLQKRLKPLRRALFVLLVVTLVANGALLGAKALGIGRVDPDGPIPGPDVATARTDLTGNVQERLSKTRNDASYLRKRWQEVQSKVPITCDPPNPFTDVQPQRPSETDARIYPDWYVMNASVNMATRAVVPLRDQWLEICRNPKDRAVYFQNASAKIVESDSVVKLVEQSELLFEKWQNAPAPTYYPSETPTIVPPTLTPIPSETPIPSATPIPSITPIPTAGPSPTPITPTVPPTATTEATALPPTATLIPSFRLVDFQLGTLKNYAYRVTIRYTTQLSLREQQDGTLRVQVKRSTAALGTGSTASYSIEMSETGKTFANLKNPLIFNGLINYLLKDGRYYVDTIRPLNRVGCVSAAASDKQIASLQTVEDYVQQLPDVELKRQNKFETINNIRVRLFSGEISGFNPASPDLKATVEAYVDTARNLPLRVTISATAAPTTGNAPTGARLVDYSYTYELTEIEPDLSAIRVPQCR